MQKGSQKGFLLRSGLEFNKHHVKYNHVKYNHSPTLEKTGLGIFRTIVFDAFITAVALVSASTFPIHSFVFLSYILGKKINLTEVNLT
jgi:hypothetical protein